MVHSTKKMDESIQSIQESLNQIVTTAMGLPEETIRWKPSEEEWSILQILSHLVEAIPYWLNEVERVVHTPSSKWGRGLQDEARLAAVSDVGRRSVDKVIAEVEVLKEKVMAGLSELDEETLAKENPHRNFEKFGNKPVKFIVDHFIDEHIAGHCSQIKRNLSKLED